MGLPVIDILHAKHPDIRVQDLDDEDQTQAFSDYLLCNDPMLIFCYEDYVARIAPKLSGGATGLCGVDGKTLKGWILRHRVHFYALREEMDEWVQWLNNDSPPYITYQALNAACGMAAKKTPGV